MGTRWTLIALLFFSAVANAPAYEPTLVFRPNANIVSGLMSYRELQENIDKTTESYVIVRGPLTAEPHEYSAGYFNIGQKTTVYLVPQTPGWQILMDQLGKPVDLVVRPQQPRILERIDK